MAVAVIRVDQNKGYVDLSRRRVSHEEQTEMEEKFAKSKMVHSVMRNTAGQRKEPLEELCKKISWPLYELYPHAYDAFKLLAQSGADEVWDKLEEKIGQKIDAELRQQVRTNIQRRLTTQAVRLRSCVDVTCYEYEGIDAVKSALKQGQACETEDVKLQVSLIAPPQYSIATQCIDRSEGFKVIDTATEAIRQHITKAGGNFNVRVKTEVVGNDEDADTYADEINSEESDSDSSGSEDQEGMGDLDEEELEKLRNMKVDDDDE